MKRLVFVEMEEVHMADAMPFREIKALVEKAGVTCTRLSFLRVRMEASQMQRTSPLTSGNTPTKGELYNMSGHADV